MYGRPKFFQVAFASAVELRISIASVVLPVRVIPEIAPNVVFASWLIANPVLLVIVTLDKDGADGAEIVIPPPELLETVELLTLGLPVPDSITPHQLPVDVQLLMLGDPPETLIPAYELVCTVTFWIVG